MSPQKQTAQTHKQQQKRRKTKPAEAARQPGSGQSTADNARQSAPLGGNIAALAQQVSDPRLRSGQRQGLVEQIARQQGNLVLQRVFEQAQAEPTAIQKEDGATVARGGGKYTVVAGDSLWRIARTTYGAGRYWRNIYEANPDKAARGGNLILIGTELTLPVLQVAAETAPEVEAPSGGSEPAVGPIGMSTEFGSFDIYPDDFIGPLPVSVRNAETWPIKQADFDNLNTQLSKVKEGTANLSVEGTDKFKTGVFLDLAWLMTSGVGQTLINEIQAASHTVKITETGGGNSEDAANFDNGLETTDVPPKAGPGSNAVIKYNPNTLFIKDGSLDWHNRPPAIGLAHEMIHAWADVHGRSGRGKTGAVPRYELQAVGLDEYRTARISENNFRAAFGLPLRPVY